MKFARSRSLAAPLPPSLLDARSSWPLPAPGTRTSYSQYLPPFHTHANTSSRNSFLLILMQTPRGWGYPSAAFRLALFCSCPHSFAERGNSSPCFSIASALFVKTPGVYPLRQLRLNSQPSVSPLQHFCLLLYLVCDNSSHASSSPQIGRASCRERV